MIFKCNQPVREEGSVTSELPAACIHPHAQLIRAKILLLGFPLVLKGCTDNILFAGRLRYMIICQRCVRFSE